MRIENGVSNNQSTGGSVGKEVRTEIQNVRVKEIAKNESYNNLVNKPSAQLTMDEKNWINLIEKANKAISGGTRSFEFSIHEETNAIMVKVIDNDTHEIIREIPNEKILDMVAKMWDMAGIFVDERR